MMPVQSPKPVFKDLIVLVFIAIGLLALVAIGVDVVSDRSVQNWQVDIVKGAVMGIVARSFWLWRGLFKA